MTKPVINLTGMQFGRLTVLGSYRCPKDGKTKWRCICACGKEKLAPGHHLKQGQLKSCGCLNSEVTAQRNRNNAKHGMWQSKEFALWTGMLARCYNPKHENYHRYGGRGIVVCDEWRNSFPAFFAHMGKRPSPDSTLEREDNDGPYAPGNVKWASKTEQANNRRNTRYVDWEGERISVANLARRYGLSWDCVSQRLERGVSGAALVTSPHPGRQS